MKKNIEKRSFIRRLLHDPRGLSTGVKIVGGSLAVMGAIVTGKIMNQADTMAAKIEGAQTIQGTSSAGN